MCGVWLINHKRDCRFPSIATGECAVAMKIWSGSDFLLLAATTSAGVNNQPVVGGSEDGEQKEGVFRPVRSIFRRGVQIFQFFGHTSMTER